MCTTLIYITKTMHTFRAQYMWIGTWHECVLKFWLTASFTQSHWGTVSRPAPTVRRFLLEICLIWCEVTHLNLSMSDYTLNIEGVICACVCACVYSPSKAWNRSLWKMVKSLSARHLKPSSHADWHASIACRARSVSNTQTHRDRCYCDLWPHSC